VSDLEYQFLTQCRNSGFPEPEREYRFHPTRKWRLDFFWDQSLTNSHFGVAVEIEGGTWIRGRHVTGSGVEKDIEKYNEVALANIVLIRATSKHVKDGRAVEWLRRAALWNMDLAMLMRQSDGL